MEIACGSAAVEDVLVERRRRRRKSDIRREQAAFDVALVDERAGQHAQLDVAAIGVASGRTPQRCGKVPERGPAGLLDQDSLGEHLVQVELEGRAHRGVDGDVPEPGDGLEEAVVTAILPVHSHDLAQPGSGLQRGGFTQADREGRDDDLVDQPPGIGFGHDDDVQVAQAAGARELSLHVRAGDPAQAVVRHAHGQQAGDAPGVRLCVHGLVEPAQPIEQLVAGRLHTQLDRVVVPVALLAGGGGRDRVPQRPWVRERADVLTRGGVVSSTFEVNRTSRAGFVMGSRASRVTVTVRAARSSRT